LTSVIATLAACRLIHYATLMLMFGSSALLARLQSTSLALEIERRLRRTLSVAALLAMLSLLVWLPLESATIGDGWSSAGDREAMTAIILKTGFGHVWDVRIVLTIITLCVAVLVRTGRPWILATSSGVLLASLGLTGHAAMHEGLVGWSHRLSDALHMLFAGAWLGSLVPFFWLLRAVRDSERRIGAVAALRTFSNGGHVAVAGVLLSGSLNTWFVLRQWPVHWQSPYQALLALKIAVTAIMVVLAISNRYYWVPIMRSDSDRSIVAIRKRTIAGVALGIAVLALVSLFGLLEPH
jgi:putative copper resistance protein D